MDSVLIGLTFSALTLGAMLTVADSRGLMNKVNAKEEEKKPDKQPAR
ncbi:MAG: hypothetical protein ABL857_01660 [Rickettsiales bacterium]|jgi:hypothetical protein